MNFKMTGFRRFCKDLSSKWRPAVIWLGDLALLTNADPSIMFKFPLTIMFSFNVFVQLLVFYCKTCCNLLSSNMSNFFAAGPSRQFQLIFPSAPGSNGEQAHQVLWVNGLFLAGLSPYFQSLCDNGNFNEANAGMATISDVPVEEAAHLMLNIHPGDDYVVVIRAIAGELSVIPHNYKSFVQRRTSLCCSNWPTVSCSWTCLRA